MTLEQVRTILHAHGSELAALGVDRLAVFGSVARGSAQADSDVDFLLFAGRPLGLLGLGLIHQRLEELLNCRVDLGTTNSLRPEVRAAVAREQVDVWPLVA